MVLLGGFGILALTRFDAVRSATTSARAIVTLIALFGGWWVLARLVLPRVLRHLWLRTAVLTGTALVIVGLIVVPYYDNERVVETFPAVDAAADRTVGPTTPTTTAPSTATSSPTPAPTSGLAPPATTVPEATTEPTPSAAAAGTEPVLFARGELAGIGHSARGTAALYRQPDGSVVVGLEDIDVQSGPDYFVHVVPGPNRESPDGPNLGALRGNQGTQYYPVPADTAVDVGWTVLIWCRAFAVPVANATPGAV